MDYLSQLRDVKSVIASVFSKCSTMKYNRLSEEAYSQENMNELVVDMYEGETLNCDLVNICDDSSSCNDSSSLAGSVIRVCDKGSNSSSKTHPGTFEASGSTDSGNSSDCEDIQCKLVVTYYFSFEIDDDEDVSIPEQCDTSASDAVSEENCDQNVSISEQDSMFEDSSFCFDGEAGSLEYSSIKNGSKNNLLDDGFNPEVGENVGLVDYDSDSAGSSSENSETSTIPAADVSNEGKDKLSDSDDDSESVSKYCGNPSNPSMRKGYIYYSSDIRLYQGELRYGELGSEKKFKLARRLLKKIFPSQKYVVNP